MGSDFRVMATYSHNDSPPMVHMRQQDHQRVLSEAASKSAPCLLQTRARDAQQATLLLLGKLGGCVDIGLVELIIEHRQLDQAELHALEQRFGEALELINVSNSVFAIGTDKPAPGQSPAASIFDAEEFSAFLTLIHSSIELPLTAANVVNESRRLLDYDRVSLLVEKGGKQRLVAISGQPSVNRRSQTTQLLEQLASRVLHIGRDFWYPADEDLPHKIRTALDAYVHVSQTRRLALLPIRKQDARPESPSEASAAQAVIGGLVFEKFQELGDVEIDKPRMERIVQHAAHAIGNALEHQQLFLYPVWKLLGKTTVLTRPKYLPKTLIGLGLSAAAIMILLFWPVRFYVNADGILMPSSYKPVFSAIEGEIEQVFVEHGDHVSEGQKLLQMSSREHDFRVEELGSQLKSARQRLTILEDQRYSPTPESSAKEIEENLVSLRTRIENYEAQLAILNEITEQQTVYSPLDGQVITWDVRRQLENRVVRSGVRLLEVADIEGEWLIEIDLPIRRQGHIARALKNGDLGDLKVSFLLAVDTSQQYLGRVVDIADVVSVNADNQQVIKLIATIENSDITIEQVRSAVSAKVYCGKSSLGYLWFHDIGEFVQKNVFFRFF